MRVSCCPNVSQDSNAEQSEQDGLCVYEQWTARLSKYTEVIAQPSVSHWRFLPQSSLQYTVKRHREISANLWKVFAAQKKNMFLEQDQRGNRKDRLSFPYVRLKKKKKKKDCALSEAWMLSLSKFCRKITLVKFTCVSVGGTDSFLCLWSLEESKLTELHI